MRGRNTILSHYHYRVDTNIGKGVYVIHRIPCACQACVDQLDKYWLQNCFLQSQPRYAHVEKCYYNKTIEHYNHWIIMESLDNKIPRLLLDNTNAFFIAVISTDNV